MSYNLMALTAAPATSADSNPEFGSTSTGAFSLITQAATANQPTTTADWKLGAGSMAGVQTPSSGDAGTLAPGAADGQMLTAEAAGKPQDHPLAAASSVVPPNNLLAEASSMVPPNNLLAEASSMVPPAKDSRLAAAGGEQVAPATAGAKAIPAALPPLAALPDLSAPVHPKSVTAQPSGTSINAEKDTPPAISPSTGDGSKPMTNGTATNDGSNAASSFAAAMSTALPTVPPVMATVDPAQATAGLTNATLQDKQGSSSVKGAASAGGSSKSKVDGSDAQSSSLSSTAPDSTLPAMKVTEAPAALTSNGNGQQTGANENTMQQAVQSVLAGAGPAPAAAHAAPPSATTPAEVAPTPQPANPQAAEPALPAINSAQLMQNMHGSEMRVGMNSAEFGNISISTAVSHQAVSTQITLDHAELGRMLAVHLPSIEQKLGTAYGLQARVELRDSNNLANGDTSGSAQNNNRQSQGRSAGTGSPAPSTSALIAASAAVNSPSLPASTSRLDILI
jgi:hypothetical protein